MKTGLELAAIVMLSAACGSAQAVKQDLADDAYAKAHKRCIDENETKAEIDLCREQVRIQWGKTPDLVVKDAGADR